jgi:hypothetical protein
MPEYNNFAVALSFKMALQCHVLEKLLSGIGRLRKVNVCHREYRGLLQVAP